MHSLSSRLLPSFSSSSIHPLFSSSYRPHPHTHPFLIIIFLSFISIIAVIIISTAPVKEQSGVQRSGLIGLQISEIAICVGGVYGKVITPMQNMMLTNDTHDDDDVDVDCGSNNQILVRCEIESGHIQINPRVREGKDWIAAISKTCRIKKNLKLH